MTRSLSVLILERLRAPHWALLVFCLLVSSSLMRTAHNWEELRHAVAPVTPQHHQEHHVAGHLPQTAQDVTGHPTEHFHPADHSHEPAGHSHDTDADTEHHREHHAQSDDNSHHYALFASYKKFPIAPESLTLSPPDAVLVCDFIPPTPCELNPFGRAGPPDESAPKTYLSLPLSGRSPPVI